MALSLLPVASFFVWLATLAPRRGEAPAPAPPPPRPYVPPAPPYVPPAPPPQGVPDMPAPQGPAAPPGQAPGQAPGQPAPTAPLGPLAYRVNTQTDPLLVRVGPGSSFSPVMLAGGNPATLAKGGLVTATGKTAAGVGSAKGWAEVILPGGLGSGWSSLDYLVSVQATDLPAPGAPPAPAAVPWGAVPEYIPTVPGAPAGAPATAASGPLAYRVNTVKDPLLVRVGPGSAFTPVMLPGGAPATLAKGGLVTATGKIASGAGSTKGWAEVNIPGGGGSGWSSLDYLVSAT